MMSGVRYRNVRAPVSCGGAAGVGQRLEVDADAADLVAVRTPLDLVDALRHAQDQRLALGLAALADEEQQVALATGAGRASVK